MQTRNQAKTDPGCQGTENKPAQGRKGTTDTPHHDLDKGMVRVGRTQGKAQTRTWLSKTY